MREDRLTRRRLPPELRGDGGRDPVPVVGEVERPAVRPADRSGGWGRRLAAAPIDEARAIGCRKPKLDALEWMAAARKRYARPGSGECS